MDDDVILRKWPNVPRPYHHIILKKKNFQKGKNRLKTVRPNFSKIM